jgi:hypothetical protein
MICVRFKVRKLDKIPFPESSSAGGEGQTELIPVEKVQTQTLEGLFEIPQVKLSTNYAIKPSDELDREARDIIETSKDLLDTSEIVKEFNKIRDVGCLPYDENGRPVIVCPSLYSLDVEDDFFTTEMPTNASGDGVGRDHFFLPTTLEEMIELPHETPTITSHPDERIADRAANKLITRAIKEAAQLASTTDYEEKSDTTQLLLSILLDTCQKVRDWEDPQREFHIGDLESIWESATEQVLKATEFSMPPAHCSVTQNEMAGFVRTFMESTRRTMLHLLRNPYIPSLLLDAGTKSCRISAKVDNVDPSALNSASVLKPSHVRKIVASFVEGAISEASQLLGSGDPFSFRSRDVPLNDLLKKSKSVCDQVEQNIEGVVGDFFLAGALLSRDAVEAKKVKWLKIHPSIHQTFSSRMNGGR